MASPKKRKQDDKTKESNGLREGTKHWVLAILFFLLALFFILSPLEFTGVLGRHTHTVLVFLFGTGFFLIPLLFFLLAVSLARSIKPNLRTLNLIGAILLVLSGLGIIDLIFGDRTGGIIGRAVAYPLESLLNSFGLVVLLGVFVISLLIIFDIQLLIDRVSELIDERKSRKEDESAEEDPALIAPEEVAAASAAEVTKAEPPPEEPKEESRGFFGIGAKKKEEPGDVEIRQLHLDKNYVPPPISLLARDSGKPNAGDVKAKSNIIKRTLSNFGIEVEMDEISVGPSVTRYALKPAEGVKLARIVALQNDLALALAAHPIRIEAPIPGKSLVGIEIPNTAKTTVGLGDLVSSPGFTEKPEPLLVSLGRNITGAANFANLARMPHLLIAGTTGSGKSVMIHTLIVSLLYRNAPENLRFIMVDPKRVELTLYNNIPHLLTPVITNPKKAILALKWAAKEMERRYDILETESVRDIGSYHENVLAPALRDFRKKSEKGLSETETEEEKSKLPDQMPYIVVIIDELADIMSTYPRELEAAVVRLAQMSRAVGIHLVLSTQRPSTEIITGLIKANVPARIALQVPSQIDSRTIIDMPGAEKLLGSGDLLFLSGDMSKPMRLQSAYISESEVKKVTSYLKQEYADEPPLEIGLGDTSEGNGGSGELGGFGDEGGDDDDLYEEARETVIAMRKASTSLLQRKLKVGYARAARLIDMLEERGIIGPGEGAKPREVFGSSAPSASDELASDEEKEQKGYL